MWYPEGDRCAGGVGTVSSLVSAALQFFTAAQCLLDEPWPQPARVTDGSTYDFIVVGGGTAGAALAARLSEMDIFSVLLIEAGGQPPQETIIPKLKDSLKGSPYDWNFTTVNDFVSSQALQGGMQHQPRGKVLGGSGSINDMVYARGFPADYDEWAAITDDDTWAYNSVLKYFKKTEHLTDERIINDSELMKYHSRNGNIEVAGLNTSTFETDVYLKGFEEMGFDMVKDMTNPQKIGAGRFSHTIKNGRRDSSVTGLLNPAARRRNLHVLTDAFVSKLVIDDSTVVAVEVIVDDYKIKVNVKQEVIVTAGTFNTPKLLMLSGLGPKRHLEKMGIKVIKDLPIGSNLHDHAMVLNFFSADNGTCTVDAATTSMEMIKYLSDQTGMYSRTNSMGAYLTLEGDPQLPEFAIYPSCMPTQTSSFYRACTELLGFNEQICLKLQEVNQNRELFTVAVVLLKPKSRGSVKLNSLNPADAPLIYSGTFNNKDDLVRFPEAIDIAMSLVNTSYFTRMNAEVIEVPIKGCKLKSGYERSACKARAMVTSAWHAVGTAAMGSVVDSKLRVIGMRNLRVADASVMPKVIRGNTNAPVIMIAEKAADFIKEYYLPYVNNL